MRRYERKGEVGMVYDWMGSLSLTPEYFTLSMPDNTNLQPLLTFPDEDACFQGLGGSPEDSLNSTAESNETMSAPFCVSEKPPPMLMEGNEM